MKLYCVTDEVREDIVSVFMSKNDVSALKLFKFETSHSNQDIELKLYSLDISLSYEDKLYGFLDCDIEDYNPRLIYSFPQDTVELKENVVKDIIKDSQKEENNECL